MLDFAVVAGFGRPAGIGDPGYKARRADGW